MQPRTNQQTATDRMNSWLTERRTGRKGRHRPVERFGATRIFGDAASLASASAFSAVLGMAYWGVAARFIPAERLGVMTAVLAAITTSAIIVSGLGDTYTALLPAVGRSRPAIYRRGQRVFVATSAVSGIIGASATMLFIQQVKGSIVVGLLVAVGTVLYAGFMLQNNTLAAIGRARWTPFVTLANSSLKIILLCLFSATFMWHSVELSIVVSAGLTFLLLRPLVRRIINTSADLSTESLLTHDESLKEFNRLVPRTFGTVALSMGSFSLTPFLVTVFAGPREGALFALAFTIVQTLDLLNAAMGTSLVVHASGVTGDAEKMARSVLSRALALAIVGSLFISIVTPIGLPLLNQQYRAMDVTVVVVALCLGAVARTFGMTWAAIERSRRNMRPLLILSGLAAVIVISLTAVLSHRFGAVGGAYAVSITQLVIGIGAAAHYFFVGRHRFTSKTQIASDPDPVPAIPKGEG